MGRDAKRSTKRDRTGGMAARQARGAATTPAAAGESAAAWFPSWPAWWLVLLLVTTVRGVSLLSAGEAHEVDRDAYLQLARSIVAGEGYALDGHPTAFRPPLYPLVLAGALAAPLGPLDDSARVWLLHFVLGMGTVIGAMGLARRLAFARGVAVVGLTVGLDPLLLYWGRSVMTETLAALLSVAGLWCWHAYAGRPSIRRATMAGGLTAVAALCRPVYLVWFALCAAVVCLGRPRGAVAHQRELTPAGGATRPDASRRSNLVQRLLHTAAAVTGLVVVLAPWVVRNAIVLGRPVVATTHGGYTLLLGNNPDFYDYLRRGRWGEVWQPEAFLADYLARRPSVRTAADECRRDRWAYAEAWRTICREPGMFAWATLVRIGRLWSPLPHRTAGEESPLARAARWMVGAWYLAVFGLAVWGLVRLGAGLSGSPWVWGLLLVLAVSGLHSVYWSNMRMRAPLVPVLALAVGAALDGSRPKS